MEHRHIEFSSAKIFQYSIICLLSVLITCVMIEGALRLINYDPFGISNPKGRHQMIQLSSDHDRGYELIPNAKGYHWYSHVKVNKHGFRGKNYNPQKTDQFRIAVLGDSLTFGNFLPNIKSTYVYQLESLFSRYFPSAKVEAMNLALGGYDTLREVATLKDIGLQFSPDVVVVPFVSNDIFDFSPNMNYIKRVKTYQSGFYNLRLAQLIRSNLDTTEEALHLLNIANNIPKDSLRYAKQIESIKKDETLQALTVKLLSYRTDETVPTLSANESPEPEQSGRIRIAHAFAQPERLARIRYALEELKELQKQHGFHVLVYSMPYLFTTPPSLQQAYHVTYDIIEHESTRLGFDFIKGYKTLETAGLSKLRRRDNDPIHLNQHGHSLIAKDLYDFIRTHYIKNKPCKGNCPERKPSQ
jgi:lysophospholipase L1-like esterase